tara:strand:+ start:418 stop:615 length:198 start_codon:yes stop_codon:yes gene_type:complete
MSYIITQSQEDFIRDIDDIDALMDEEKEKIYIFDKYEDAVSYLMIHGIRTLSFGFPFNIKIEKIQ